MEPTSGLEPLTCRLRIDPVLRMLLCDKRHHKRFRAVVERSDDPLYSSWYSNEAYPILGRHAQVIHDVTLAESMVSLQALENWSQTGWGRRERHGPRDPPHIDVIMFGLGSGPTDPYSASDQLINSSQIMFIRVQIVRPFVVGRGARGALSGDVRSLRLGACERGVRGWESSVPSNFRVDHPRTCIIRVLGRETPTRW